MTSAANLPPDLPIEHEKRRGVHLGNGLRAHRGVSAGAAPDAILLGPDLGFEGGSITLYLTPAMIVHMANTLLTDGERAAILAPALAGANTE